MWEYVSAALTGVVVSLILVGLSVQTSEPVLTVAMVLLGVALIARELR